ncbi:MAG: ATP-binding cassette domain-containing protein [Acidobacteriota bacterium]
MPSLVDVRGLVKDFSRRVAPWSRPIVHRAVDQVDFTIEEGESFGLVGESGSGKTTTGRCLLRLVEPTAGSFTFEGQEVFARPPSELRDFRRRMQMVFQDPLSSLNPRMRAGEAVEEGLVVHRIGTRPERRDRVEELFRMVGLDPAARDRFPHEFSGGQRQRIGLARALALEPSFLIADEPVSALDVSIQAQVINLFMDLQQRLALTLLFIAHDLRLVRHLCSRVAVMYRGRVVEMGRTIDVFDAPCHPYTRALLSAVPGPDLRAERLRLAFSAESVDLSAPLREVAPGHAAAVP